MPKQLNVNLAFTADSSQARAQIDALQRQLSNLMNQSVRQQGKGLNITNEIMEATKAAANLKVNLETATNVNTGKLDLSRFVQNMQQSGMSLEKYQKQLSNLGPAGDQAFATLAKSISTAEIPLKRTNKMVDELWTSLKNTARWQLSSSMLHGFMGALSSANAYAQDLNASLNNIRIVTGYNTDQMAKFAEQANKAAKDLSTTTTRYSDSALIYFQQGTIRFFRGKFLIFSWTK